MTGRAVGAGVWEEEPRNASPARVRMHWAGNIFLLLASWGRLRAKDLDDGRCIKERKDGVRYNVDAGTARAGRRGGSVSIGVFQLWHRRHTSPTAISLGWRSFSFFLSPLRSAGWCPRQQSRTGSQGVDCVFTLILVRAVVVTHCGCRHCHCRRHMFRWRNKFKDQRGADRMNDGRGGGT